MGESRKKRCRELAPEFDLEVRRRDEQIPPRLQQRREGNGTASLMPPSKPPSLQRPREANLYYLYRSSSPLFPRFFSKSTRRHTWLSESQEKQNMARRGQQLSLPSVEGLEAILNESDGESADNGSAVLSGNAATPATVTSLSIEDESDADEEVNQARSQDKGKGRALDADATPAAMVGVTPQELPQLSHVAGDVGDAAHLRAYSADYADMAPGSDGDDGESAGTGAAKRQRTADSNGSRYVGSSARSCRASAEGLALSVLRETDDMISPTAPCVCALLLNAATSTACKRGSRSWSTARASSSPR